MRASNWGLRLSLLGTVLLALGGACSLDEPIEPDPEAVVPSGTGTVFGRALDMDFEFGPAQVTGVYAEEAGSVDLDLNLCEVGCGLLGIEVEAGTRAVLINLVAPVSEIVPGAILQARTDLTALAVYTYGEANSYAPAFQTVIEEAQSGSLIIDTVNLAPGGAIAGRFDFTMDHGGAITGSFVMPLLAYEETGEGR